MATYVALIEDGKEVGRVPATRRQFSSGSIGFYAHGKVGDGDLKMQVSANLVIVHSKNLPQDAKDTWTNAG